MAVLHSAQIPISITEESLKVVAGSDAQKKSRTKRTLMHTGMINPLYD